MTGSVIKWSQIEPSSVTLYLCEFGHVSCEPQFPYLQNGYNITYCKHQIGTGCSHMGGMDFLEATLVSLQEVLQGK